MTFQACLTSLVFGALASGVPWANATPQITRAVVTVHAESTKIVVDSPKVLRYRTFTVENPTRLVLDLDEVQDPGALSSLAKQIPTSNPLVHGVRIGRFQPGTLRVVMDLRMKVKSGIQQVDRPNGSRLILDIDPADSDDPVMALLARPIVLSNPSAVSLQGQTSPPAESLPQGLGHESTSHPQSAKSAKSRADSTTVAAVRSTTTEPEIRAVVVALDAGHGGEDPGARGAEGTLEKTVTLAIARKLKSMIDGFPNMRAVLIRDGDQFIPLHERVARARNAQADLFVSIHADAFIKSNARGSSVFALSDRGATSAAARWLAKRENDADLLGGVNIDVPDPNLKKVLLDLSQTATVNDSLRLARSVLTEMSQVNSLHKRRVEQAGFAVLKAPDIPSILIETAFISNREEEQRLIDEDYQTRLAEAIFRGIASYLSRNPPLARGNITQRDSDPSGFSAATGKNATATVLLPLVLAVADTTPASGTGSVSLSNVAIESSGRDDSPPDWHGKKMVTTRTPSGPRQSRLLTTSNRQTVHVRGTIPTSCRQTVMVLAASRSAARCNAVKGQRQFFGITR
ncbi:MAG: N-acetylmuramoyl-L-alanine amidase [Betaproteobacteria bacterium]